MRDDDGSEPTAGQNWDSSIPAAVRQLADELLPVFYADLKRLAHRERSRVGAGMTMQTTALVHEAYLRLRGSKNWVDDTHFLRAAALAMRHALVNHAKARLTAKRGSGVLHVPLTGGIDPANEVDQRLVALNEALAQLAQRSQRLSHVVECRYFAGYDDLATARALGISERTVRRDWTLARAWLQRELAPSPD